MRPPGFLALFFWTDGRCGPHARPVQTLGLPACRCADNARERQAYQPPVISWHCAHLGCREPLCTRTPASRCAQVGSCTQRTATLSSKLSPYRVVRSFARSPVSILVLRCSVAGALVLTIAAHDHEYVTRWPPHRISHDLDSLQGWCSSRGKMGSFTASPLRVTAKRRGRMAGRCMAL